MFNSSPGDLQPKNLKKNRELTGMIYYALSLELEVKIIINSRKQNGMEH
jgi:hypothetical protein